MQKNPNGLQALKHEIAILTKIRHPHVVQLFEVMDDDTHDQVYMVFELLQLGAIMNMSEPDTIHRIPEEQARIYFRQMVQCTFAKSLFLVCSISGERVFLFYFCVFCILCFFFVVFSWLFFFFVVLLFFFY